MGISCGSNAESTTWLNLKQYRGLAWSIGGDSNADTMPNMMKQFSPDLVGVSTGTGDSNIGCNKAIGGAVVQDMPGQPDKRGERRQVEGCHHLDWRQQPVRGLQGLGQQQ